MMPCENSDLMKFLAGLRDDLAAVREHHHRLRLAAGRGADDVASDDGFAAAGRCDQHDTPLAGGNGTIEIVNDGALVGPQLRGAHEAPPFRARGNFHPAPAPLWIVLMTECSPSSLIRLLRWQASISRSTT